MPTAHLAIDFGAGSGRVVVGLLADDRRSISVEVAHRFEHGPVPTPAGPVWDLTHLWRETLTGLSAGARLAADRGATVRSVGADTWAVDWCLVTPSGEVMGLPHAYRDPAHLAARQRVYDRLPGGAQALYSRNGLQPLFFNTVFQLEARRAATPELLTVPGAKLLMLPDLLHWLLCGAMVGERTNASTTGLLTPSGQWDHGLAETLGLPTAPLPEL